jgi:hypothetical protein
LGRRIRTAECFAKGVLAHLSRQIEDDLARSRLARGQAEAHARLGATKRKPAASLCFRLRRLPSFDLKTSYHAIGIRTHMRRDFMADGRVAHAHSICISAAMVSIPSTTSVTGYSPLTNAGCCRDLQSESRSYEHSPPVPFPQVASSHRRPLHNLPSRALDSRDDFSSDWEIHGGANAS